MSQPPWLPVGGARRRVVVQGQRAIEGEREDGCEASGGGRRGEESRWGYGCVGVCH